MRAGRGGAFSWLVFVFFFFFLLLLCAPPPLPLRPLSHSLARPRAPFGTNHKQTHTQNKTKQGNRIFTSGATGTNAAVIKGALRAIEGDGKGGGGGFAGSAGARSGGGGGGGGGSGGGGGGGSGDALDAALAGLGRRAADAAAAAGVPPPAPSPPASSSSDDDDADAENDGRPPASAVASGRRLPSSNPYPKGDDDRLTVILPQSLDRQPPESRDLLARVGRRVVEMPRNDALALADASRICNREIIASVQQVVCFAFRDSRLLLEVREGLCVLGLPGVRL